MATSITHRATGIAISVGMVLVAWGLLALASGPELYQPFTAAMGSWIGLVVLAGFAWSLVYHFLNGIRHLAWDLGYGYEVRTANRTGVLVTGMSILLTIGIFACAWWELPAGQHP